MLLIRLTCCDTDEPQKLHETYTCKTLEFTGMVLARDEEGKEVTHLSRH